MLLKFIHNFQNFHECTNSTLFEGGVLRLGCAPFKIKRNVDLCLTTNPTKSSIFLLHFQEGVGRWVRGKCSLCTLMKMLIMIDPQPSIERAWNIVPDYH
jgi:hypothetical protein